MTFALLTLAILLGGGCKQEQTEPPFPGEVFFVAEEVVVKVRSPLREGVGEVRLVPGSLFKAVVQKDNREKEDGPKSGSTNTKAMQRVWNNDRILPSQRVLLALLALRGFGKTHNGETASEDEGR